MANRAGIRNGQAARAAMAYVVLAVGLGLTVVGTIYVAMTVRARERLRFQAAVHRVEGRLDARVATYTAMMRATDGLYAARWPVWPDEFKAYAARLDLRKNYPGVFGIGVALRSPAGGRAAFETYMRDGMKYKDFKVWPAGPSDGGEWTAVIYLEPGDERNGKAIGYDMYTEPVRRAAMDRVRDEGTLAASGRVTLVQDKGDANPTTGFVIYLPVYADRVPPATVEERRAKTRGFVFCPFRSKDLFGDVFAEEVGGGGLEVRIYDGGTRDESRLLYRTADGDPSQAALESTRVVDVAGRPWMVAMAAAPGFYAGVTRYLPAGTAGFGALLSAGLFLVVRGQVRGRLRAERITADLRVSQAALREAKEVAETANRLKDEFLATVSHELRTPLNAILGWAQLLANERVSGEDVTHGVETILRNARMQTQLIEDLLDISRIVSGKLRLEARPVDLAGVVRAAIGSVQLAADAKGVGLVEEIGDGATVSGDPDRLQQVVWNLLTNSIKFTERGGTIVVRSWREGEHARVEVRDTGVGIDPEFLPYVFERFRQADGSLTRKHGGLGLGLSIVRNLAELHGGTVRAASQGIGRGATFTVSLPVRVGAMMPKVAATSAGVNGNGKAASLEGVRVLVVDDDPDTRELVRHILAGQRAEVVTVGTVRRALEELRAGGVGVLVSDLAMPEEDGYDLIRMVRELPGQYGGRVPAVALSALVRAEERERALAAGYQVHLPKPVDAGRLVGVVGELGRG